MAGTGFTITAPELPGIEAALGALLARSEDLSPLMDRIGMAMETTTAERFEAGVAPDGTPWKPSRKPAGKTLIKDGFLKGSVTHRAGRDQVEIGTNKIYARIHQFGGTIRAKDGGKLTFKLPGLGFVSVDQVIIPARPFLGVSSEDEAEIEALTADYLLEDLAA